MNQHLETCYNPEFRSAVHNPRVRACGCPPAKYFREKSIWKHLSKRRTNPSSLCFVFSFLQGERTEKGQGTWELAKEPRHNVTSTSSPDCSPFPLSVFTWNEQFTKNYSRKQTNKQKREDAKNVWRLHHYWFSRPWYCHSVVYFSSPLGNVRRLCA